MTRVLTNKEGRFHVHILPTDKFRARHIMVKVVSDIDATRATASAMLPYLWMEGTRKHPSALSITRYADQLFGAAVRTSIGKRADRHVLEVYASAPEEGTVDGAADVFAKVTELVYELLTEPLTDDHGFVAEHVEREQRLHKKRIQSVYDDKISYAMERCLEEMCKGDPLGVPRLGYLEQIDELGGKQLFATHQQLMSTADVHVYLIGNFNDSEALAATTLSNLQQAFGRGGTEGRSLVRALPKRAGDVREVVEHQPVNQGKLNLGFRTGVSYHEKDYPAMFVANGVLGMFPHSKLFVNVREKASLAYYASSRLEGLTGILAVQTGIEIADKERALDIIQAQVKAMQDGEISDEELEFTKRGLRNQYQQVLDQPASVAEIHFSGTLAGVHREVEDLITAIEQVQKNDVHRMSQQLQLDTVYFLRGEEAQANA